MNSAAGQTGTCPHAVIGEGHTQESTATLTPVQSTNCHFWIITTGFPSEHGLATKHRLSPSNPLVTDTFPGIVREFTTTASLTPSSFPFPPLSTVELDKLDHYLEALLRSAELHVHLLNAYLKYLMLYLANPDFKKTLQEPRTLLNALYLFMQSKIIFHGIFLN